MLPLLRQFRIGSIKPFVRPSLLAWGIVLAGGFYALLAYQMRAGPAAPPLPRWPAEAGVPFDSQRYNLVMFAHPECPCTRASLGELEIVLTQQGKDINAAICFIDPENAPGNWTDASLERAARRIPGLRVVIDRDGIIANKFGALTSGQVMMFDPQGRSVFSGGITGSRGHAGENLGRSLVLALAAGGHPAATRTPVFGCALHDADFPGKP